MIAFLPRTEAVAILARDEEDAMMRGEMEAELGSSYFYGGMSSSDATLMASMDLAEQDAAYAATFEGQRYIERLEAARFMTSAISVDMRVSSASEWGEFPEPWGTTRVPEFIPGISRKDFLPNSAVINEDIPF